MKRRSNLDRQAVARHHRTAAGWQHEAAQTLIASRGTIVAEFFDTGCSRRRPWCERPRVAVLLAALTGAHRPFDAVVVGEYERAFFGTQLIRIITLFQHHGVQVWLPEAGEPIDIDTSAPTTDDNAGCTVTA